MTELIIAHSFEFTSMPGNCGARLISRLKAAYTTEETTRKHYALEEKQGTLPSVEVIRNSLGVSSVCRNLSFLQNSVNIYHLGSSCFAYPVEWAFGAALTKINEGTYGLIFMSDTEHGDGDGHTGSFATRHFAEWLIDNDLVDSVQNTGDRYLNDNYNSRYMTGWVMTPNIDTINAKLSSIGAELVDYIDNHNKNPAIDKSKKVTRKQMQVSMLDTAWGLESPNVVGQGEPDPLVGRAGTPNQPPQPTERHGEFVRIRTPRRRMRSNDG